MRKTLGMLLAIAMILSMAACGDKNFTWTREGYFSDDSGNLVYTMKSEDESAPGWYVGCMLEEGIHGAVIAQEGKTLKGDILAEYEEGDPFIVTVSEEGEDGILFAVKDGGTYHLLPYEIPTASIVVLINTDGFGTISYAEGSADPEFDEEYPMQSGYIGLAEPETYTIEARPDEGWKFHNWTKDGEEVTTDMKFTAELSESGEYVAHFGVKGKDETHVDLGSVETLGQLLGLPDYGTSTYDDSYVYAFEQDWNIYRAVAELPDETREAVCALDWDDENYDEKLAELLSPLKVLRIENLSEMTPAQEEMDALIGKTGKELFDDGWYCGGWNFENMIFYMSHGPFEYVMEFDGDIGPFDEFDEEDILPLVVRSVRFERIGSPASL